MNTRLIGLLLIGILYLLGPASAGLADGGSTIASAPLLTPGSVTYGSGNPHRLQFWSIDLQVGDQLTFEWKWLNGGGPDRLEACLLDPSVNDGNLPVYPQCIASGEASIGSQQQFIYVASQTARFTVLVWGCVDFCDSGDWTGWVRADIVSLSPQPAAPIPSTQNLLVKGTVACTSHAVTGVWVQSTQGGSGWAKITRDSSAERVDFQRSVTGIGSTDVEIHVGCGGTPRYWWSDNWTTPLTISASATLYVVCSEGIEQPKRGYNRRCSWSNSKPGVPAATGDYPWANATCVYGPVAARCNTPDANWGYPVGPDWQKFNPTTGYFAYRNCTDYVAWRLKFNAKHPPFSGDARAWKVEASGRNGWITLAMPHVGDIAWWGNYNHVAVVTAVTTGSVTVAEYDWPVTINGKKLYGMYGTRKLVLGSYLAPQAYLHRS